MGIFVQEIFPYLLTKNEGRRGFESCDHFDPGSVFLLSCKQDDTLMLTGVEKGGKDEFVNAWEMDERAQARNAQEEANNCGVWMECEEYGLGPHAE